MEKVLNQEQIDAMVRAARGGGGTEAGSRAPTVTLWDARQAGQIGREQMRSINLLHEAFARNLTHSLGAYLRIVFAASLVSAEHLTYGEFLQRIPEVTYLSSANLSPMAASALMQLDLSVAFPLIDVLLGGEGKGSAPDRQITEIEEQIVETVMRIICRELQKAWQALALEFQFEARQRADQVQHLMPAEEKTLSLSFEITLAESRGTLNIVVPAVVSNALLRKISAGYTAAKLRIQPGSEQRLRALLLRCPFRVELGMTAATVPLGDLVGLSVGTLLMLRQPVERPAALLVGGQAMFSAAVVRRGATRAAQLLEARAEQATEKKRGSGQ
jgi:flagellar motor switch protein FliM